MKHAQLIAILLVFRDKAGDIGYANVYNIECSSG